MRLQGSSGNFEILSNILPRNIKHKSNCEDNDYNSQEKKSDEEILNDEENSCNCRESELEKLKQVFSEKIQSRTYSKFEVQKSKEEQEKNFALKKMKVKCDKISKAFASGRNVSEKDKLYLKENSPQSFISAMYQRNMIEMKKPKQDDEDNEKETNISNASDPTIKDINKMNTSTSPKSLTSSEIDTIRKNISYYSVEASSSCNEQISISL